MTPTYDQLLAEISRNGVNFSDYDLALAKENPTAGYGILQSKIDFKNATTPEAQALAHANAEAWRGQSNYSGGADGSYYNPIMTQTSKNTTINGLTQRLNDYPSFSYDAQAPTFADEYKGLYDQQLNNLLNYKDFSYDYKTDPLYGQYKQAYNREGQRATADALGQAAAASGGIPSSFAATAAAQAGNYYAAQLADKIPDLYQMAYQQYADQYNRINNNVNQTMGARNFDFGVYQSDLGQFNTDRNFAYNTYADEYNRLNNALGISMTQDETAYTRGQAAMNDARNRISAFLSAGGNLADLPADLRSASGMSDAELNALAMQAALANAPKYYGTGKGADTVDGNLIDFDQQIGRDLVHMSANDPNMAADILSKNWGNLGYTERFSLLQNMGYDNDTAIELARGDNNADLATYMYYLANPAPAAPQGVDVSNVANYSDAEKLLKQYGSAKTPLSVEQWNETKRNGKSQFNTYTDYLKAFVDYNING